jgi:hypothetical protein
MVKIRPWTVTVPVRVVVEVLAAKVSETVPLPKPLPPAIVIQLAEVATVHEQPVPAVTVKLALPPAAGTLAEVGDRL